MLRREIGGTLERLQSPGVDPLHPAGGRVLEHPRANRVAERKNLARLAQDDHRGRPGIARGRDEALALPDAEAADAVRRLRAPRAAVLAGPRARPVAGGG